MTIEAGEFRTGGGGGKGIPTVLVPERRGYEGEGDEKRARRSRVVRRDVQCLGESGGDHTGDDHVCGMWEGCVGRDFDFDFPPIEPM